MIDLKVPEHLSAEAKKAWDETIKAYGPGAARIVGPLLEQYACAVATARESRRRVDREGIIVADAKGAAVPHPALSVEARALATIQRLAPKFAPPPRRTGAYKDGFMVRATIESFDACPKVRDDQTLSGIRSAALTLAWIIDESQRAGGEQLRRAAYGPIQSYIKALEGLGLAPTVQAVAPAESEGAGATMTSLAAWKANRGA